MFCLKINWVPNACEKLNVSLMDARQTRKALPGCQVARPGHYFMSQLMRCRGSAPDVMCYTAVNANFSKLIPTAAVAGQFVTWRYVSYGNVVCTPTTKLYLKTHNSRDYH